VPAIRRVGLSPLGVVEGNVSPAPSVASESLLRTAAAFAARLEVLATELRDETAPIPSQLAHYVALADFCVRRSAEELTRHSAQIPKTARLDEDTLRTALRQFHDQVRAPLSAAQLLTDPQEISSVFTALADRCADLGRQLRTHLSSVTSTDSTAVQQPHWTIVSVYLAGFDALCKQIAIAYDRESQAEAILDAAGRVQRQVAQHLREAMQTVAVQPTGDGEIVQFATVTEALRFASALTGDEALWDDRVVTSTGDGAMVRFATVTEALRFASALHAQTVEFNRVTRAAPPYQYRVGIASGHVLVQIHSGSFPRRTIAGIAFIQAARLGAAVPPGGTAIAAETWDELLRELGLPPDEAESHPLCKGFEATVVEVKQERYPARIQKPTPAPTAQEGGAGQSPAPF
jgi:class 3 adenylate cyclase